MSHRNANGIIQYNPQNKSYRLVNDNGIFYSNGRFFSRSGARGNYDIITGNFLRKKVNKPAAPVKQQSSAGSKDIVSLVTNPNYLYGYKKQVNKQHKIPTNSPATNKPRTPAANSWINKDRGIWNYSGVSQADVANAYKTGDFSKVGSYLSQHEDLASYLNDVYSKRGGNQFNWSAQTPAQTPARTSARTSAVNTRTLQTLHKVVPKSPVKEVTSTVELPTYNRSQTRDYMRSIGMNPYDYSGGERKALRTYLNNPGSMDPKYQPFINQVQNQRTQKRVNSIGTNQLLKPETDTNKLNNQLVNLKFEKGGQMYKYAAGAQMAQQTNSQGPIDQIAQIAAESLQGDENSKQQLIQVLSNKEIAPKLLQIVDAGVKNQDKRAVIIAQAIKALQQGSTRKARLGAKLDYIKQSIGECPEGQEVVYFKKGGEICKICAGKKMQDGGKSDPIKNFKKKKDVAKQTYQRNPYTRG